MWVLLVWKPAAPTVWVLGNLGGEGRYMRKKAIHAAVGENIPRLGAVPRIWKAGPFTTVPAAGDVLSFLRERKYQRSALRSRLLPHDAWE